MGSDTHLRAQTYSTSGRRTYSGATTASMIQRLPAITAAMPRFKAAGTSSMLNPFTVSLVGIVAGVMSEDIAKWIQERGRGFLTQGGVAAARQESQSGEAVPGGGLVNNQAIS